MRYCCGFYVMFGFVHQCTFILYNIPSLSRFIDRYTRVITMCTWSPKKRLPKNIGTGLPFVPSGNLFRLRIAPSKFPRNLSDDHSSNLQMKGLLQIHLVRQAFSFWLVFTDRRRGFKPLHIYSSTNQHNPPLVDGINYIKWTHIFRFLIFNNVYLMMAIGRN